METPKSVYEIDLRPDPERQYWSSERSWKEEAIYFLLVDRFHDDHSRKSIDSHGIGMGRDLELQRRYGGKIRGITEHLNYIQQLGCTAIWLSPVFENDASDYHGYAIQNFLNIDPRFGTKQDLKELIKQAHQQGIKVFLDVVINHAGDIWSYQGSNNYSYKEGKQYVFGAWRSRAFPIPVELRNPQYYQCKGYITQWDEYPETREGDFFSLKKFKHEETEEGLKLQDILFKIHAYWVKELDCDGFRMDAAKHLGELPAARFATRIKEYASSLGKKEFFVFGEVAADDMIASKFIGPVYSEQEDKIYQGFDSLLDFPIHFQLPKIISRHLPLDRLKERFQSIDRHLSGQNNFHGVNFLDNHDQIEAPLKKRIGAQLEEIQMLGALGILFCLPGVPCIYYGTEQGYQGQGMSDSYIREAMFDLHKEVNGLNQEHVLYQYISKILNLRRQSAALLYGDIYFPPVFSDKNLKKGKNEEVIVFTREALTQKVLIGYNTSLKEAKTIYMKSGPFLPEILYGAGSNFSLLNKNTSIKKAYFLRVDMQPGSFVIATFKM